MNELFNVALKSVVDSLDEDGNIHGALSDLRPSLRQLRGEYRKGHPDFSSASARIAYGIAYHPYHAHLAATVYRRFADALDLSRPKLRLTILGAGPAPELLAFLWFLRDFPQVNEVEVDLVDREPGWVGLSEHTVVKPTAELWTGKLTIRHHTLDLASALGIDSAAELIRGRDLVIAQAIFTELRMRDQADTLMRQILGCFGPRTQLLAIDFARMSGFAENLESIEVRPDLRTLRSIGFTCPMPLAPPFMASLYTGGDGLMERRKAHVEARLYARPGWAPQPHESETPFRSIPDQQAALDAIGEFVAHKLPGVFLLTGPAGSGKSLLIRRSADLAERSGRYVEVWAPTGQVARRLSRVTGRGVSTIHSALYGSPETQNRDDEPPLTVFKLRDNRPSDALIFIDESSLIGNTAPVDPNLEELLFGDGRLLDDIVSLVKTAGNQIVFVGDLHQLPPIGEKISSALSPQFFADQSLSCRTAELLTISRHNAGSTLAVLAKQCGDAVRSDRGLPDFVATTEGNVQHLRRSEVPEWLISEMLDGSAVAVTFRHADARVWNIRARQHGDRPEDSPVIGDRLVLAQASHTYGLLNGEELRINEVGSKQRVSIREESVTLRSLVLEFTDTSGTITNFDAMVVEDLLHAASQPELKRVTRVLWRDFVRRTERDDVSRKNPEFFNRLDQDPFVNALRCVYSYARTCHRAQGGEWDHVICDLTGTLALGPTRNRFGYTAVTRAKHTLWLQSWPSSRRDHLAEFTDFALGRMSRVVHPVVAIPQNNGSYMSLRRWDGDTEVVVNLYGSLKFHIQKLPEDIDRDQLNTDLQSWAEERLANQVKELDPCVVSTISDLGDYLQGNGLDLEASESGSYQVRLVVSNGQREALLRCFHRASGLFSSEVPNSAHGDSDLLEVLRASIGRLSKAD